MIMLLLDSGARRAELVGLRVEDLDFEHDVARVIGKGRRERAMPFGRKTAVALDRYLRIRSWHAHAASPWLWLGQKGPLTATGLAQMLWRRGRQAGIEGLHAHQLRHTFAHAWLAQGGPETDLMRDRWLAFARNAPALRCLSRGRTSSRGPPAPLTFRRL